MEFEVNRGQLLRDFVASLVRVCFSTPNTINSLEEEHGSSLPSPAQHTLHPLLANHLAKVAFSLGIWIRSSLCSFARALSSFLPSTNHHLLLPFSIPSSTPNFYPDLHPSPIYSLHFLLVPPLLEALRK